MKRINRILMLMLAIVLLIPSAGMAQELDFDNFSDYEIQFIKEYIAETIDYSDSELYPNDSQETYSMYSPMAVGNTAEFDIYHRNDKKLSMSDDAFDKSKSTIIDLGDAYEITLYTKPVSKKIINTYYADCTNLKYVVNGQEIEATSFGSKPAVNNENKTVPEGFKFTINKADLEDSTIDGYTYYFRILFETNISDSGFMGKIAAIMMNPNARFFIK